MRWILLLALAAVGRSEPPVAGYTRTQLKVGRSLVPTETVQVPTRDGGTATLVVKKRDGRGNGRPVFVRAPRDNQPSRPDVPNPVNIRSDTVFVKGDSAAKRGKSIQIGNDGIPEITGVRVPDDPEDKVKVWRNARVINGVLVSNDQQQVTEQQKLPTVTQKYPSVWKKPEISIEKHVERPTTPSSLQPTSVEWLKMEPITTKSPAWNSPTSWQPSQADRVATDQILEYIKKINRQEVLSRGQINSVYNRFSRGIKEAPKLEARILQTAGETVFPTSLLYSPPSSQKSKVIVEEGVRTPVLQYAHPELGVQAAQPSPPEDDRVHFNRDKALAYFAHDIHSDRSPYAFEPGLEDEARVEDFSNNDKRSNTGYSPRPKKNLNYYPNGQSIAYNDKYYNKYGPYKDYYIKYVDLTDRRPFWEKIGDTIKDHMEYGLERMQDIARPVVDPLVEATHKISANLGFHSGTRELNSFKEKVGLASTGSMLFPALGLVAGGAALGLGAVAVGRYLDVDLLRRSHGGAAGGDASLPLEHKRALAVLKRGRRGLPDELQRVEHVEKLRPPPVGPAAWASTPCAKRAFCQVMLDQSSDDVSLMEKKMASFLRMMHPRISESVSGHLDDVMDAIRRRNCSIFQCPTSPR